MSEAAPLVEAARAARLAVARAMAAEEEVVRAEAQLEAAREAKMEASLLVRQAVDQMVKAQAAEGEEAQADLVARVAAKAVRWVANV